MSDGIKYMSIAKGFSDEKPHCFRCGDCCVSIPVEISQVEIDLIQKRLNRKEKRLFFDSVTVNWRDAGRPDEPRPRLTLGMGWVRVPCMFLEWKERKGKERAKCKVYYVRPQMCRNFYCGKSNPDEPLNMLKYTYPVKYDEYKAGKLLRAMISRPDLMKELAKIVITKKPVKKGGEH